MSDSVIDVSMQQNAQLYSLIPTASEGDKIIEKLPEKFRDGSMLMNGGDALHYFKFYLFFCLFFTFVFHFFRVIFTITNFKPFM